ncbi:chromate efflux transporter [Segetibacter sp. 3557_3]|uniref:chromate efflux transporter n=1 Tax=Segetibacter sp. 3557_3 TaxID=2547429 RepID=UPI0021D0CAB8|nr:chromate efflux transporter [Segetibacter sp. 3557_3]
MRHIPFLRAVLKHSLTAFGGPQMHFVRMHKLFVQKHRYISEDELLELNAFVQLLPGASSSQTLTLIGYRRGGVWLAIITLAIWILPACTLMAALSFLLLYLDVNPTGNNIFQFIPAMAVGFLVYSAFQSSRISIKHQATLLIMLGAMVVTVLIKSPWVFPTLIILGSVISNFSDKRIPKPAEKPKPIKWGNLSLFVALFVIAGIISEVARIHQWEMRKPINLFENFYRFGSLVFGGGSVLIPMMFEQYVNRPQTRYITAGDFLTGAGMVQAFPGPVFSIASFVGGMVLRDMGPQYQVLGAVIGSVAIFLPSLLLVLFFYPIWQILKKHVIVFRAMEGINAVVVGIMWAATILLFKSISIPFVWSNLVGVVVTFCLLKFTRFPSPFIVLAALLLGWLL